MDKGFAIVVDIGKTLSKVTLWSRSGRMLSKLSRPNLRVSKGDIIRLDTRGIAAFVEESLSHFAGHPVEYIIPVAHGAAIAAVENGALAYVPIDYEQEPPEEIVRAYRKQRPAFRETGSPALPACLNCAIQLFWADTLYPGKVGSSTLMPWAQYWAWFLSGAAATEVSSLGCHSDLWNPAEAEFSGMAEEQGWAGRFAPLRRAGDVVGTLRPDLARRTGLPKEVKILAGLHDSNAALIAARGFAEIEGKDATILSTGTWFIALRLAGTGCDLSALPEQRDCLVNVDPSGHPILSARFMGGREIEMLIELDTRQVDIRPDQPRLLDAVPHVLAAGAMVLPTLAPGNGPFPHGTGGWIIQPDDWFARRAGACLYAALMANESLDLIGSRGRLLIEGRFAEAEVFVRALAALRPDTEVFVAKAHNDVSFGALRLIEPALRPTGELQRIDPLPYDLAAYAKAWQGHLKVAP
ncbi:carbohydrate kinase [Erythrobacter sp.]|uniref:FGGY-family carbohydrate kinase n=1 Tax=Erythrobacter sp. TaxID=1042 RepID=UPI0025DB96B1|nr:carbohydrate kinase [Erythrobacter sp.]